MGTLRLKLEGGEAGRHNDAGGFAGAGYSGGVTCPAGF